MGKLTGKTAVVTGAARGIGREYALRLASLGANIGVIDINLKSYQDFKNENIGDGFETVVEELSSLGVKAIGAEADITSEEEVISAFEKIQKELGSVDILIANAGGGTGTLDENTGSTVDKNQLELVMARNLYGTIYSVKAVIEQNEKTKVWKNRHSHFSSWVKGN